LQKCGKPEQYNHPISVEDLIMDFPKEKVPVELKRLSKLTLTLNNQTFTSLT
jgi:hypothetical protein